MLSVVLPDDLWAAEIRRRLIGCSAGRGCAADKRAIKPDFAEEYYAKKTYLLLEVAKRLRFSVRIDCRIREALRQEAQHFDAEDNDSERNRYATQAEHNFR
jgi:hypothetical protein